ncbi:MAG: hypothetical protein WCT37_00800 [Patescibacteria group bacterium]|jgi:hypothetical protein
MDACVRRAKWATKLVVWLAAISAGIAGVFLFGGGIIETSKSFSNEASWSLPSSKEISWFVGGLVALSTIIAGLIYGLACLTKKVILPLACKVLQKAWQWPTFREWANNLGEVIIVQAAPLAWRANRERPRPDIWSKVKMRQHYAVAIKTLGVGAIAGMLLSAMEIFISYWWPQQFFDGSPGQEICAGVAFSLVLWGALAGGFGLLAVVVFDLVVAAYLVARSRITPPAWTSRFYRFVCPEGK